MTMTFPPPLLESVSIY